MRQNVATFVLCIALRRACAETSVLPVNVIDSILTLSPSSIRKTTFFSVFEMSSIR